METTDEIGHRDWHVGQDAAYSLSRCLAHSVLMLPKYRSGDIARLGKILDGACGSYSASMAPADVDVLSEALSRCQNRPHIEVDDKQLAAGLHRDLADWCERAVPQKGKGFTWRFSDSERDVDLVFTKGEHGLVGVADTGPFGIIFARHLDPLSDDWMGDELDERFGAGFANEAAWALTAQKVRADVEVTNGRPGISQLAQDMGKASKEAGLGRG